MVIPSVSSGSLMEDDVGREDGTLRLDGDFFPSPSTFLYHGSNNDMSRSATRTTAMMMMNSAFEASDWSHDIISDIDGWSAQIARAMSSPSDLSCFLVSPNVLEMLKSKRFSWFLVDLFEGALLCGLASFSSAKSDWCLALVNEFFAYAKSTLQLALPICYRMESLIRAQRGEDVLAIKAILKARQAAKRYHLLFEERFDEFIYKFVMADIEERDEMLFEIPGSKVSATRLDSSSSPSHQPPVGEESQQQQQRQAPYHDIMEDVMEDDAYKRECQALNTLFDFKVYGCEVTFGKSVLKTLDAWLNVEIQHFPSAGPLSPKRMVKNDSNITNSLVTTRWRRAKTNFRTKNFSCI
jgi:hypothetical protein